LRSHSKSKKSDCETVAKRLIVTNSHTFCFLLPHFPYISNTQLPPQSQNQHQFSIRLENCSGSEERILCQNLQESLFCTHNEAGSRFTLWNLQDGSNAAATTSASASASTSASAAAAVGTDFTPGHSTAEAMHEHNSINNSNNISGFLDGGSSANKSLNTTQQTSPSFHESIHSGNVSMGGSIGQQQNEPEAQWMFEPLEPNDASADALLATATAADGRFRTFSNDQVRGLLFFCFFLQCSAMYPNASHSAWLLRCFAMICCVTLASARLIRGLGFACCCYILLRICCPLLFFAVLCNS
jgi:hypothetical protein